MAVYNDLSSALNKLSGETKNLESKWKKAIMIQFISDVSTSQNVPIKSGDLRDSALTFSDFDNGKVIWNTEYADKVYNKNQSGVVEWDIVSWNEYEKDYEDMVDFLLNQEIQNKI